MNILLQLLNEHHQEIKWLAPRYVKAWNDEIKEAIGENDIQYLIHCLKELNRWHKFCRPKEEI